MTGGGESAMSVEAGTVSTSLQSAAAALNSAFRAAAAQRPSRWPPTGWWRGPCGAPPWTRRPSADVGIVNEVVGRADVIWLYIILRIYNLLPKFEPLLQFQ